MFDNWHLGMVHSRIPHPELCPRCGKDVSLPGNGNFEELFGYRFCRCNRGMCLPDQVPYPWWHPHRHHLW